MHSWESITSTSTERSQSFTVTERDGCCRYECPQRRPPPHETLRWRHNERDSVSNHQPHGCLLNGLLRHRSQKTSKLRVTGLCVGNSPGPVNSPHKGPVTRKMFPFDDVIMTETLSTSLALCQGNLWVTGDYYKGSVIWRLNISVVFSMNMLLNKWPNCKWFETPRQQCFHAMSVSGSFVRSSSWDEAFSDSRGCALYNLHLFPIRVGPSISSHVHAAIRLWRLSPFSSLNSMPPSDAYMRQSTGSASVQVKAFGAKPLPQPKPTYYQSHSNEQAFVKNIETNPFSLTK